MLRKRKIQIKQGKYNKNEENIKEIDENKIDLSKCSGRVRTRPLEFWNFEKIEVRRTDGKLEVIHHKPYFPLPRSQKSKVKGRDQTSVLINKRRKKASSSSKSSHSKRKLKPHVQHLKEESANYDNRNDTNGILPNNKDDDDLLHKLADAEQVHRENSDKICSPLTKPCSSESNCPVSLSEKLSSMSLEEAESHIKTSLPFLRRVVKGQEANERHRVFMQGGRELQQMTDYLIYHPYSEDQIFFITDFLESKFSGLIEKLYGRWNIKTYIWKVLTPTSMIRIAMEIEKVTSTEAEKMLMNTLFVDD